MEERIREAYEKGKKDGIASVLSGVPFTRTRIAIYMLINAGYSYQNIATMFSMSSVEVREIYDEVKEHFQKVLLSNEEMAISRLLHVLKCGDEETDGDLF